MFSPKDVIGIYTMIYNNCDTMVGYSVSDMIIIMQPRLTYVDVPRGRTTELTMDSTGVLLHLLYTDILK